MKNYNDLWIKLYNEIEKIVETYNDNSNQCLENNDLPGMTLWHMKMTEVVKIKWSMEVLGDNPDINHNSNLTC